MKVSYSTTKACYSTLKVSRKVEYAQPTSIGNRLTLEEVYALEVGDGQEDC